MSPPAAKGDSPILGPDGRPLGASGAGSEHAEDHADEHGGASRGGEAARGAGEGAATGQGEAPPPLPEASLTLHVFHLASQVAMALGETEHPLSGKREIDLRAARFLIDTLAMLESKTHGNRTPEEDEYLEGVLTNLRMAYVKKSG